jgi:hypothetical protein
MNILILTMLFHTTLSIETSLQREKKNLKFSSTVSPSGGGDTSKRMLTKKSYSLRSELPLLLLLLLFTVGGAVICCCSYDHHLFFI